MPSHVQIFSSSFRPHSTDAHTGPAQTVGPKEEIASTHPGRKLEKSQFKPQVAAFLRSGGIYKVETDEGNKIDVAFYMRQCRDEISEEAWNTSPPQQSRKEPVTVLRHFFPKEIVETEESALHLGSRALFKTFNSVAEAQAAIDEEYAETDSSIQRDVILRDEKNYSNTKVLANAKGKVSQGAVYTQQEDDEGNYSIATEQLFVDPLRMPVKAQKESVREDEEDSLPCRRIDLWEFTHTGHASSSDAPSAVKNVGVFLKGNAKPLSASAVGDVEKIDEIHCYDIGDVVLIQGADQVRYGERALYIHSHGSDVGQEDLEPIPKGIAISTQAPYGEALLGPDAPQQTLMYPTYETLTHQKDRYFRNHLLDKVEIKQAKEEGKTANFLAAVSDTKESAAWAAHDSQIDIVIVKARHSPSLKNLLGSLKEKGLLAQYNHIIFGGCQNAGLGENAKARGIATNFMNARNTPESAGVLTGQHLPPRKFRGS